MGPRTIRLPARLRSPSLRVAGRATWPTPPGPAGLVASYGFEEGTGTTTGDATGNGHQGTLSGATWPSAGKNGNGISFDGSSDWVTVNDANDLDLTTGMTIEAWVFPTTTNSVWRTVIAKDDGNNLAYAMQANSTAGRPYGLVTTGGEQLAQGPAALPVNTWCHLATTYDGAAVRLYVNGALVDHQDRRPGSITTSGSPLHFGGNQGLGEWFQGRMDDIRVYNRALAATELQTDMNTAVPGTPAGPPPPPPPGPDKIGSWTAPTAMPLVGVHISLLPNGRVAMWDGATAEPGSERIWDPDTDSFESTPGTRNLFCAAYVKLPDGRLAVFGGHTANYNGIADVNIYDYKTKTWKRGADMARGRWYPSATMLSDGRVLVVSGDNFFDQPSQPSGPLRHPSYSLPEIYDPVADSWTSLPSGRARHAVLPADVPPAERQGLRRRSGHHHPDTRPEHEDVERRRHEPDHRAHGGDVPPGKDPEVRHLGGRGPPEHPCDESGGGDRHDRCVAGVARDQPDEQPARLPQHGAATRRQRARPCRRHDLARNESRLRGARA